jgi:gamma-glutamyltranspeptidase/glutathione hydrolase
MRFWPVIALAERGVIVLKKQEERLKEYHEILVQYNGSKSVLSQSYKENDTIKYPALAATLKRIAKMDVMNFTKGTAKKLVQYLQSKGGIITMEDLGQYSAKWRTALTFLNTKI